MLLEAAVVGYAIFKATRSASKSWLDCWLLLAAAGSCGADCPSSISQFNQACSPSLSRPGHLLRAHHDIHSTRTATL